LEAYGLLKEIFAWWTARMLECLPERLRQFDIASDAALIVAVTDAGTPMTVTLSQIRRGREEPTGRFVLDDQGQSAIAALVQRARHRSVRVRLPESYLLERSLLLPLVADRDLAAVLSHEIDRITPFRADEIFWQFAVAQRDRAKGQMTIRLSLVPKAPWATLLTALAASGVPATTIELPQSGRRIDVDRNLSRREQWARHRQWGVAGLFGVMAVLAIIVPFVTQALALHAVSQQIASLRPDVAKADTLRRQITNGTTGIDAIAAEEARTGDVLAVLAAVTDALPDDTYLTSLSLRQGHLSLSGQSTAAAQLIGTLSGQHLLRNAAFDAPITRSDQAKLDLFSIRADLVGSGSRP
jgi:general secretion pathway protein L